MLDQSAGPTAEVPIATRLAVDRTRLAHDRTLLAWVRTATSLISFGFTIHKFFQYLHEKGEIPQPERLVGPREFALIMITIGLVALLIATIQHRTDMVFLRRQYPDTPYSLATLIAGLIAFLGLMALVAVIFRH